jgi:ECF transporter S component (folate family)
MQQNTNSRAFILSATALLTAISIILGRFSIYIPLFGFPSVRFSLATLPVFLVGALFGGTFGAISGIISDLIGFLLSASGPYHAGFTINSALAGLLPGLFFTAIKKHNVRFSFNVINAISAVIAFISAFVYINFIGLSTVKNLVSIAGIPGNVLLTALVFIIIGIISAATYLIEKKHRDTNTIYTADKIIFILIINYIIIQIFLTPIWLFQLYSIPVVASLGVRLFKSTIDIPLQVTLLYLIIKYLPVRIIENKHEH